MRLLAFVFNKVIFDGAGAKLYIEEETGYVGNEDNYERQFLN